MCINQLYFIDFFSLVILMRIFTRIEERQKICWLGIIKKRKLKKKDTLKNVF